MFVFAKLEMQLCQPSSQEAFVDELQHNFVAPPPSSVQDPLIPQLPPQYGQIGESMFSKPPKLFADLKTSPHKLSLS